jgi:hypothetical protein
MRLFPQGNRPIAPDVLQHVAKVCVRGDRAVAEAFKIERRSMMTKLLTTIFAATLAAGINTSMAQNVKSDQDKAQGQEQKMQEKETGAGGQQGAPTTGDAAKDCKGMTGRAKEQCMKKGSPATGQTDSGTAQHRDDQKPKQ